MTKQNLVHYLSPQEAEALARYEAEAEQLRSKARWATSERKRLIDKARQRRLTAHKMENPGV